MSIISSRFYNQLLEDSFGITVRQAAEPLIQHGPLTLLNIARKSTVPLKAVKQCLQILIQHNIIEFSVRPGNSDPIYTLDTQAIFSLPYFSKYCRIIDENIGADAHVIIKVVARVGRISVSKLLFLLGTDFLQENSSKSFAEIYEIMNDYYSVLEEIVEAKYLIRSKRLTNADSVDIPEFEDYDPSTTFHIPKISVDNICRAVMKFESKISEVANDDEVLWKLNLVKFNALIREEILVEAMELRIMDSEAAQIFKAMLSLGLVQNPNVNYTSSVTVPELRKYVSQMSDDKKCFKGFDACLKLLTLDSLCLVQKLSTVSGGHYNVNVKDAFKTLTIAMVEKLVESRFGQISGRIFRIVRQTGFMEQDKLMEKGMLSSKIGREALYKLVEANYITLKEVRKSYAISSSVTNKALVYIFCVDFETLLRSILEEAYQGAINCRSRLCFEKQKNKRLISKEARIEKILFNMRKSNCNEAQLAEVKEMITYPERKILGAVHGSIKKLASAQLHAHRTIFIINTYFQYMKF